MKVKLAEGRMLRDPVTNALMQPGDERDVPLNLYWRRRLRSGDVVSAEAGDKPQPARSVPRATETKEV